MSIKKVIKIIASLGGAGVVIAVLLYLTGMFTPGKISPGKVEIQSKIPVWQTAPVEEKTVDHYHEAVGTIQSRTRIHISSQINGQIRAVLVNVGQPVKKGQVLVRLESDVLQAGLNQAQQSVQAAIAGREQAHHHLQGTLALLEQSAANYERMKKFHKQEVITDQQMEQVEAKHKNTLQMVEQAKQKVKEAEAQVRAAKEAVHSAEIKLSYAVVNAPEDGIVAERLVEPGDLAWSGKPLLIIHNPRSLRLEAHVSEQLIHKVQIGNELVVRIDALDREVKGTVDEMVPSADPRSRSFVVKVALPSQKELYPGMFGRLLLPGDSHSVILIPLDALYEVGQLELVRVVEGNTWYNRYVRTGKRYNNRIEVLSGLEKDEIVAIEE
jgi:HlyD family secretion protein